jgi:hypothetical protein
VVCNMIGAPPPPPTPVIVQMDDPGAYLINWTPTPDAAGYAIAFRPLGTEDYPPFRFIGAREAGNVVLTGFEPNAIYAISLAALDSSGRLGYFSPEIIAGPGQTAASP